MVAPVSITSSAIGGVASRNVLNLIDFTTIHNRLLGVGTDSILVYTDGSLAGLDTVGMQTGAAVFFDGVNLGLCVEVSGLVFSTMVKLQTIALALDNERADALAITATMSKYSLPLCVDACYILAGGMAVSENSRHFVHDIFYCIHHAQWEISSSFRVLVTSLHNNVDWHRSSLMWHSDMHMAASSIGKCSAGARTYFMKALHYRLPVAVHKCLYSRSYPSILCLYCGEVKVSDHVFSCSSDTAIHAQLLDMHVAIWEAISGLLQSSSQLMQLMLSCISNTLLCSAFCKGFMFKLCF
ncbi:hypothetical protein G9A89_011693 [Geosiphon pyriformis]|nr:hypothetical protein G9A89_011693 [Geosiphon pyriformis]